MIKLFVDEDVPEAVATALRLRGFDVMTVKDVGGKGFALGRLPITYNLFSHRRL